jgi:ABC-type histidine transport system ATPase subunit
MKAHLMLRDRDFDLHQPLPWNEAALVQDLALNVLFDAMAQGDQFLVDVARLAVLSGMQNGLDTILYRHGVLKDCLKCPTLVRGMYNLSVEAIQRERKDFGNLFEGATPGYVLARSISVLEMFMGMLRRLRSIADEHASEFESEGFSTLFAMLGGELNDEYFAVVKDHLQRLQFRKGVLISAQLGEGNRGTNYVLRKSNDNRLSWLERALGPRPPAYTFYIDPRDIDGAHALSELKNKGINLVANALRQSTNHILSFFTMLRNELAFYIGCLNLADQLVQIREPICFPVPLAANTATETFCGLYDICLALTTGKTVVGNDLDADQKNLVIITGANQGGKSTFLRSIGLAQLMMQCGMYVPAESLSANVCDGLFTHYKREEDATMTSGKLDEELSRMRSIVSHLTSKSMVLFNESFAATNEREGSEIARQIVTALAERRTKVLFVTHLYTFARKLYDKKMRNAIFLQAERQADGQRTFQIVEGVPSQTSYGEDLFRQVFAAPLH